MYAVYRRIAAGRVEHDKDVQGLTERLRAPFCHPNATSPALEAQLLAVRIRHPRWEPKKLRLVVGLTASESGLVGGKHVRGGVEAPQPRVERGL